MDLQKIKDFLNSEECKKSFVDFIDKMNKENEIKTKQLERLNRLGNFKHFTEKVLKKYKSAKYRKKWFNKGAEPPESLFWFLFDYAGKYGRECTELEWDRYGNAFSSELFFCEGYYFTRMDGQGSFIRIFKE